MAGWPPRRRMRMDRRTYLATLGTGVLAGLAGCIGGDGGISSEQLSSADGTADGWGQHTKLAASDDSVNQFGRSVALAGDGRTALVTADHHEAGDEFKPGPAFVLERTEGDWGLLAELTPDGGEWDGNFGGPGDSVALSDDASTALVDAERADDPNGPEAGAAYLFERADGEWAQARLVADDGRRKDFFGGSAALDGDGSTALVGAKRDEDPNRESAGSVYVFEPTDGGWRQRAKLTPGLGSIVARFGWSVDLAGDTVLVGAPGDTDPDERAAGSASVFGRDGDGWHRRATLAADDGDAGDFFGGAVALEADTALVGAMEDDDPNGDGAGPPTCSSGPMARGASRPSWCPMTATGSTSSAPRWRCRATPPSSEPASTRIPTGRWRGQRTCSSGPAGRGANRPNSCRRTAGRTTSSGGRWRWRPGQRGRAIG